MTIEKKLMFTPCETESQINDIYNFNVLVFADSQDFSWTKKNIKKEIGEGWKLFSVKADDEIVCALFLKEEGDSLLTKNTPVKLNFQGNGFSHMIKNFYEDYAKDRNLKTVYNYCASDNFRMIALNEGHDYAKTGNALVGDAEMIEWVKKI